MSDGFRYIAACLAVAFAVALPVRAADQKEIDKAVAAGVDYLKGIQDADGTFNYVHSDGKAGATALAGLTLLECGVSADDRVVQKAAKAVRILSLEQSQTYALSLSIMFLDRLGDPDDEPLIESMAVRLVAGQTSAGGWSYACPILPLGEAKRLVELTTKKKDDKKSEPRKGEVTKPSGDDKKTTDDKREPTHTPPDKLLAQIEVLRRGGEVGRLAPAIGMGFGGGDNSNTQFAILGLWVARRHGVPVDKALAVVDDRFRQSQNADGGWGYMVPQGMGPGMSISTAPMTCAGLLGLAAGIGINQNPVLKAGDAKNKDKDKDKEKDKETRDTPAKKDRAVPDPDKDAHVKAGLKALGTAIGEPLRGREREDRLPIGVGGENGRLYYTLWSIERVAVAYGLDTIGNKDWYAWGSDVLVRTQQPRGGWAGGYPQGGVDTCFALLFLRKANVAADLTTTLKGKIHDPDRVVLKAGGGDQPKTDPKDDPKPNPEPREKVPPERKPPDVIKEKPEGPQTPPGASVEAEAARLAKDLLQAPPAKQEGLLEGLRDNKGVAHTQALVSAIPKLEGDMKKKAQKALAERMARMSTATLAERLKDDDMEMRRAAALACAMKEDKTHVPRLIELLSDSEAPVARAAYAALKSLSNKDFGPDRNASREEIAKAAAAWRAWWKEQGGK
jgi:hypothetical protein